MQTIPSGPAWAVAISLIFGGLALLIRVSLPLFQSLKHGNSRNGNALGRQEAVAEVKQRIDEAAAEAREHRDKIMENIDETRHTIATPLTSLNLGIALMQQTLIEIRDRLPRP